MIYNKKTFYQNFTYSLDKFKNKKKVEPMKLCKYMLNCYQDTTYKTILKEYSKIYEVLDDYYKIILELFFYYIGYVIAKNANNIEYKKYMISYIHDTWDDSLKILDLK